MTSRVARAGAGLVLLYVVVAAATAHLSARPVLPLFDGFAPPTPYAWVNPPPDRTRDNVPPMAADKMFPLGPQGTSASNASTDDAQAIVGLEDGSVPPHPPDTSVRVKVTPVDAGTLGPLPSGLRAVSNAYRVELSYAPSQTPVTQLAQKGTVAMTAAEAGDRLLYSPDGQAWQDVSSRPFGQDHGLFGELDAPGWFVVASSTGLPRPAGNSHVLRTVLLTLAAVIPIVGAVLAVRLPSPVQAAPAPKPRGGTRKKRAKRRR